MTYLRCVLDVCEMYRYKKDFKAFARGVQAKYLERLRGGESVVLEEGEQRALLGGFRQFYDPQSWKYEVIQLANTVGFELNCTGAHGVFVVGDDRVTVSYRCEKVNKKKDVSKAMRGSVHYRQILKEKGGVYDRNIEMDHVNEGGFAGIRDSFMAIHNVSYDDLYPFVVYNDPRERLTRYDGFQCLKEPWLTRWCEYHCEHMKLVPLTRTEHQRKGR